MPPPLRQASSFRNPAGFVLFLAFSCCFDIVGASVTLFNVANFSVETPILQIDVPLVTPTYDTSSNNVTYYTCDFPRFSGSYDEDLVLLDLPLKDPPSTCVLDVEKLKADAQGSADVAAQLARGFGLLINWNAPKMQGCRRYAQLMKQIADYSISNSISPFQLRAALFTALQTTRTDIGFPFVTPYGDLSDLIPGPVYYGLIAADDGAELSRRLNGQKVGPLFVRLTGETGMWSFLITTSSSYFWGQSVCLLLLVIAALYAVYQLFLISRNSNRDHWKVRSAIHVAGLGYSIVCAISSLVPLNLLDAKVGLSFFWTSTYFQFSASNLLLFLWSSIASSIQKHTEFRVRIFRRLCFSCHALFILMTVCLIAGPDIHDFTLLRVGFNLIFIVMPAIFVIQALIFGYLAFTLISGRRLNQLSESTTITTRTIVILSFVSMLGNILLTLSAILDGLWATLTVPGYIAQMAIRQVAYVILFGAVSAGHKLRWEDGDGEEKDVGNGGWKRLWSMSKRAKPNHLETKIGMFPDAKKSAQKSKWSVIIDGDTTMYLDSGGAKVTEFGPGRISIASPRRSIDLDFAYQQLAKASSSVMASDRTADRELDPMSKGNNLPYGKASIRMSSRSTPEMNEEVDPLDTSFGETDDPPMLPDDINEGGSLSRLAKSLPQPPKANGKRARIRPPIPSPFLDQVRGARESAPVNVFDESRNSRNLFPRDSTMAIQIPSLKCLNRSVDLPGFPEDEDVLPQRSFRVLDTGILPLSALTENLPVALSQGNMRRSTYLSGNPPFARLTTAISADAEEKNWREDPPSPSKDNVPLGNPLSTYRGSIRLEPIHGIAIPHKRST